MSENFKSPTSTNSVTGATVDFVGKIPTLAVAAPSSERSEPTLDVGTAAQNPAQQNKPIPTSVLTPVYARRFWARTKRVRGCWEWQGTVEPKGYGRVRVYPESAHFRAHRVAYMIKHGEDPGDALVCHTCDNRRCVNPAHLFLGTHRDNSDDKMAKGRFRHHHLSGEENPNSTLSEADVREIVGRIRAGDTNRAIARDFSVSGATISHIRLGRAWRKLTASMGYVPKPARKSPKSGRTGPK